MWSSKSKAEKPYLRALSPRFQRWLDKRVPPSAKIHLSHRNIFILPTRYGLGFILILLLVLIAGINYQNALVHGLAFLMLGLFLIAMLQTFRNLEGLTLSQNQAVRGFVGDVLAVPVELSSQTGRQHDGLRLFWPGCPESPLIATEVGGVIAVPETIVGHRGRFHPGRLRLETTFPLGLFCAWSWLDMAIDIVGIPRPIPCRWQPSQAADDERHRMQMLQAREALGDIRNYQVGDEQRHIHWRVSARKQTLMVKEFEAFQSQGRWLSLEDFPGHDLEDTLARMVYVVLNDIDVDQPFGLILGSEKLPLGSGQTQRSTALERLALYQREAS